MPLAGILTFAGLTLACSQSPTAPTPLPGLSVASVTPKASAVDSAGDVRIRGRGFRPGATVTIGGAAMNVVVVDNTTITATTAAHTAATVDVVVTNPDGATSTLPAGYRYASLELTRVEPSGGKPGEHVRISGFGFAPGASVTMGGVSAQMVFSDNFSAIDVIVPDHDAGASDVVVINPNGARATLSSGFRFTTITISVTATAVTASTDLTVSWTVPPHESRRLEEAIVLVNIGTGKIIWAHDTSGTDSGTQTLTAPTEPGQYEFQYRDFDDFVPPYFRILGRSRAVTVTAG
jgi:hypothetical protein